MHTTGTDIAYLALPPQAWLFAHGISLSTAAAGRRGQSSSTSTVTRSEASRWQALELEGIKIDHYDAKGALCGSQEVEQAGGRHQAQLKFTSSCWNAMVPPAHGILEYPKLRETEEVWLSEADRREIPLWE